MLERVARLAGKDKAGENGETGLEELAANVTTSIQELVEAAMELKGEQTRFRDYTKLIM